MWAPCHAARVCEGVQIYAELGSSLRVHQGVHVQQWGHACMTAQGRSRGGMVGAETLCSLWLRLAS
jgi:hypothetical protein